MSLLSESRSFLSTPQEHLDDHLQAHGKLNAVLDVVADFGAVGDGVTDDSAELQAALGAADTAGGGIVFIQPDKNLLTGTTTIEIPANTLLLGAGWSSVITYTGTGTAIRAKDYATASQKLSIKCQDFKLVATSAAVGIDCKAWTHSELIRARVTGNVAAPTASSVGVLFDGSHGALIGCWWNRMSHGYVEGWDTGIKLTGVDAAGQANENTIHNKTRVASCTTYGIHVDIGDRVTVDDVDLTNATSGATGLFIDDFDCVVGPSRFENVDTAIRVGANARRTHIHPQLFSDNVTSIQIDSGALDTFIADGSLFSGVTNKYSDSGTQNSTNRTRGAGTSLIPVYFAQENVAANQTSVALKPVGAASSNDLVVMGQNYQIRGITVRGDQNVTGGTLTLKPTVGTTESTTLSLVRTGTTAGDAWQGYGKDTNNGGSGVGCKITTTAGFTPTTMDITVVVWVELVREI